MAVLVAWTFEGGSWLSWNRGIGQVFSQSSAPNIAELLMLLQMSWA